MDPQYPSCTGFSALVNTITILYPSFRLGVECLANDDQQAIDVLQVLENQVIEENELITLPLNEYFRGQLLSYQIRFPKVTNKTLNQTELSSLVYIRPSHTVEDHEYLSNTSYKNIGEEPFSSSSVLLINIPSYSIRQMALFIVTRDLRFVEFLVSGNSLDDKQIVKVNEIQLDQSLQYSKCRDLTYIKDKETKPSSKNFILFCKGVRNITQNFYTIVMIKRLSQGKTSAAYYIFPEDQMMPVIPDFNKTSQGLRYLKEVDDFQSPFKYFTTKATDRVNGTSYQLIMVLNIKILRLIGPDAKIEGDPILKPHKYIRIDSANSDESFDYIVQDFILIKYDYANDKAYFAMSVVGTGLIICGINITDFENSLLPILYMKDYRCQTMTGSASSYLFKPDFTQGIDTFQDINDFTDEQGLYFYGIRIQPPAVVEYNLEDINNIQLFKKYLLMSRLQDKKIGTRYIAMNKNYLVHLVYDPESLNQYLRVFNRHATFKVSSKFEIPIEIDYPMNFIAFPNYISDCMVLRDEREVRLVKLVEEALMIDSTSTKMDIVKKYQGESNSIILYLYVTSPNTLNNPLSRVQVTFLEKNNVDILPINEKDMVSKIFYNCGSNTFKYVVSSFYNGPNYNLDVLQSNYSNNLFIFENQHMNVTFESQFQFQNCRLNFIFPQPVLKQASDFMQGGDIGNENNQDDELYKRNQTRILVCVDFSEQQLRSYDLRTLYINNSTIYEISRSTNTIWMPDFTYFVDFQQDISERIILGIVENKYDEKMVEGDTEKFSKYELHYFEVQNQIVWKSRQPLPDLKNVSLFTYNHLLNLGLVVEFQESAFIYPMIQPGPIEKYYIFELDLVNNNVNTLNIWYNVNMTMSDRTIKSLHANEYVVVTMTVERKIRVYQKWKNEQIGLQLIYEFDFLDPVTNKSDLKSFDIFDNRFFIVYRGTNLIEVYQIDNYVEFYYKMRLPLYQDFEDYQFYINDSDERFPDLPHIVRTYLDNFFAILMMHPVTNDTQLMIYGLNYTQHNAFVLNQNLTDFYGKSQKTTYSNLIFTGQDRSQSIIGVMNDFNIKLYQTQYYNQLVMSPDLNARKQLIEECKNVKNSNPIYQGLDDDKVIKEIDSIIVQPTSLFSKTTSKKIPIFDKTVNITIKSKNQGMAVTLKTEQDRVVNISYSNQDSQISNDFSSDLLQILHETYLEGQGLSFNTLCSYKNNNGKVRNCTNKDVVNEQSEDVIYNFSIEYTTGNTKILKYFTLGKLYFMFDTNFKMNVLRFPIYQQDLKTVSGFPLRRINEQRQDKLFGCNITGFSDYYNMTEVSSYPNETYLFMYQCKNASDAQLQLNAAVITSYNDAFNQDDLDAQAGFSPQRTLYQVRTFPDQAIQVPYQIIDLDKINMPSFEKNLSIFRIAFTCEIPGSETNLLKFYTLKLNLSENGTCYKDQSPSAVSGYNYQRDSFKVSKILPIPESKLFLVVSEEFGFYFFNMTSMFSYDPIEKYMIGELDVQNMINFKEQIAITLLKPFKIISFTLNLPTQVICVTTYGIIIIEYPVDLRNETQIISNYPDSLQPKSKRHIQGYYNEYSKTIVQNAYGNAFLVKTLISGDSLYRTQLLGMSFFSSSNSLVFKLLSIPAGIGPSDQCSELNPSHYFELTPEDQLAVSFICNQYLYVYRMCMRPHVELDFSSIVSNSTSGLSANPGILQFNQFQITLQAWNEKSGSQGLNRENVTLYIDFGEKPSNYKSTIINAIILMAVSLILVTLAYLENALCRVQKDFMKQQKEDLNRYSSMITAQRLKRQKSQQLISNYRINHTTDEQSFTANNLLVEDTDQDQKLTESVEEQVNRSPRFATMTRLSRVAEATKRPSQKQLINRSVLTGSMTSDM